jgi:hypothetical protein
VIARRSLARGRQITEMLIDVTLSHVVLLFGFVFGGVIAVPGGDYREYMLGGILVQTLAFGVVGAVATALREDLAAWSTTPSQASAAKALGSPPPRARDIRLTPEFCDRTSGQRHWISCRLVGSRLSWLLRSRSG